VTEQIDGDAMETQTYGIEETKDVITFISDLAGVIEAAKSDGKLDIFDAIKLLSLSPSAVSAAKGSAMISKELSDLNGEERDALLSSLKDAIFKLVGALT
jgi:hypothetical protein